PGGEAALLGVGRRGREGGGGRRLERRARGRGDRDDGRGVDRDGDHGVGGLAAAVGDRGGDGVRAGGERARRDRPPRAEPAVAARGPGDRRGEVAVLAVAGGDREGDRGARVERRAGGGGGDQD